MAPRINTAFYHGGEPIRILRPFLEGGEQKPYFLAMTAAGQSALNVRGLDTVIIDDVKFFNVIDRGRNVLTQEHLGANEILQMAGRVHGRVEGGRVFILSDRDIQFEHARSRRSRSSSWPAIRSASRSRAPRSACAPTSSICRCRSTSVAYRNALALLEERGIVENGRLTTYGRAVEAMPVERAWAELLVNADDDLLPYLAVMSSVESLHRMTREERDLDGLIVPGSDHLTAYNLYAEAYQYAGQHGRGVRSAAPRVRRRAHRAVGRAARRAREIDRGRGAGHGERLSRGRRCRCRRGWRTRATTRCARSSSCSPQFMPFTLVIDEQTASGDEARVSKTSVCGSWGPIAGELRYFADKFGNPRASIEGTQVPYDVAAPVRDGDGGRARVRPGQPAGRRSCCAGAWSITGSSSSGRSSRSTSFRRSSPSGRGACWPRRWRAARRGIRARARIRTRSSRCARRIGARAAQTPRLSFAELTALYERQLARRATRSSDFRHARVSTSTPTRSFRATVRERYAALPSTVSVRGRDVEIHYDVEETPRETRSAWRGCGFRRSSRATLTEEELPTLDRPLRFIVTRGARGAARGNDARRAAGGARASVHRRRSSQRSSSDDATTSARRERTEAIAAASRHHARQTRGDAAGPRPSKRARPSARPSAGRSRVESSGSVRATYVSRLGMSSNPRAL